MNIEVTAISGMWRLFEPNVHDSRGYFRELRRASWAWPGMPTAWPEVDVALSQGRVLRGIHGDAIRWKILSCVYGTIMHVGVDIQTRQWVRTQLMDTGPSVILAPGVGSGYYVTSDVAVLHYQQSQEYVGAHEQFTYRWNDPAFKIDWGPYELQPILSERDATAPLIA